MLDSVLRGAQSMLSFMVATFADLLIRVIMCYILDPVLGIEGIWWSWPIGWVAATLISVGLFAPGKWYKSLRAQHLFPALQKDNATADTNEREAETKTE